VLCGIAGQYLPDFVLYHRNFDSYIEVKSHTVREGELEDTLRRMPVTGNPSRAHSSPSSSGTSDAIPPRSSPACTAARSAVTRLECEPLGRPDRHWRASTVPLRRRQTPPGDTRPLTPPKPGQLSVLS
jgi:hypothetical protein